MLTALSVFVADSGARAEAMPGRIVRDRAAAIERAPEEMVDLACNLFGRHGMDKSGDAFRLMQEAADAGNDEAALHLSSYFRFGIGTKMNVDAADRILMALVTKIREKRSAIFPTTRDAAREIYSGRCSPADMYTSFSLQYVDETCRAAPTPKPPWCG